ncbi:hypothetical protein MYX82_05950 [Acidobacteria bacterium AH-259-D05]|nr:hypothetical protein [Acidobacteria bacterium AH-259-D05]
MAGTFARAVSRVLFWTYPRGGWQYDIISGLILAFIFLTPRAVFDGSVFSQEEDLPAIEREEQTAKNHTFQVDYEIE